MASEVAVKIGQVWRESDKRLKGRTFTIVAVTRDQAFVEAVISGRKTRIRLDRFDGKQYVLVERTDA